MGPVYHFLGLSVGTITHDTSFVYEPGHPTTDERLMNLRPVSRRDAYAADITYGTNNEFGFDYLRDNMVTDLAERVQRERSFAIVDEVDNILIDEARTPLIISGQAEESADLYFTFARLVPKLQGRPEGEEEGGDFFVDLKDRAVSPTEEGIDKIEKLLGIENLYDADPRLARHFEQALRAHALYKRDRDYIVKDGEIVIVDEFTGRQMPGRRWSEGLHQAIEAKEGVKVQRESVTLATITFQNYFRLYDKLAGMTGTAMTEAEEFHKIYELEVVAVPTHKDMIREDDADLVFRNELGKFTALIDEIVEMQEAGRPVLVGTVSVEKSEILSTMLKQRGIRHETLNAKFHERESGIVAQAGRTGAVTIATNMAGRGTDIKLGGDSAGLASDLLHKQGLNPAEVDKETYDAALQEAQAVVDEDHEKVVTAGGLHIIGTERHDSRRIDNQLRGRAGRQGDPGSSRFYLSLEDDLMKRFASDRVAGLMERMGLEDDVAIESRLVSKTIESAQSRVEGFNFDMRKRVVEFDDVINRQRETIYAERDKVLRNEDLSETIRTLRRGRGPRDRRPAPLGRRPRRLGHGGARRGAPGDGPRRPGHDRGRDLGRRQQGPDPRAPAGDRRGEAGAPRGRAPPARDRRRPRGRGGRGRVGDGRADGPPPHDRLPLGRAPDRDRRHAAGHRPPRLRPAGPAQRVPARGVRALRRAPRADPPPGRDDDLPGHRDPPAAARGGRPPAPPRRGCRAARRDRGPGRCRGGGRSDGRRRRHRDGAAGPRPARVRPVPSSRASPPTRWPPPGSMAATAPPRTARRSRGSRRPAPGSAETIRAGAGPARSTRSATAVDRRLSPAP